MNRHQRRAALKAQNPSDRPVQPVEAAPPSAQPAPGWTLKIVAHMLLSPWMLRRVKNREVLGMLREVARQAGRDSVASQLDDRIRTLK